MKVLFINNDSSPRCGIKLFGQEMCKALEGAGVDLTRWNGSYEAIYEKPYLPEDAESYDVIHLNWHPITINHYLPRHFPQGIPLSVYVNDLPPWSSCPLWDRADVRFTPYDYPGGVTLVYPCPDYKAKTQHAEGGKVLIGYSGVRGDGLAELEEVCGRQGWELNRPTPGVWLSMEDEIDRLGRSTVNVCWYNEGRGVASGPGTMAAAGRPLVVNESKMFDHVRGMGGVYAFDSRVVGLEQAVEQVLGMVAEGTAMMPMEVHERLRWGNQVGTVVRAWEGLRV